MRCLHGGDHWRWFTFLILPPHRGGWGTWDAGSRGIRKWQVRLIVARRKNIAGTFFRITKKAATRREIDSLAYKGVSEDVQCWHGRRDEG